MRIFSKKSIISFFEKSDFIKFYEINDDMNNCGIFWNMDNYFVISVKNQIFKMYKTTIL
jgi:hypothetical protein